MNYPDAFAVAPAGRGNVQAGKSRSSYSLPGLILILAFANSGLCLAVEPLADVAFIPGTIQPLVAISIGKHSNIACVVDTGSTVSVVNSELSRGAETIGMPKVTVANGTRSMPLVRLRDVAIGNARLKFVDTLRRNSSWFDAKVKAPCVLGGSFLDKFTVDLDFDANRLRLYQRGTRLADVADVSLTPDSILKGRVSSGHLVVDAQVGRITVKALIDTGWIQTAANEPLLHALGISPDGPQVETGVSASGKIAKWVDIGSVRLGGLEVAQHRVDVGDFNAMVADNKLGPYLHVGPVLLAGHRLLIDMKHHQAALVRGAGAGASDQAAE